MKSATFLYFISLLPGLKIRVPHEVTKAVHFSLLGWPRQHQFGAFWAGMHYTRAAFGAQIPQAGW
jgi:hypothetical protein